MKRILIFCLAVLVFGACDNTLDLIEEGADVSVVYSLLSASSNEQVVRLEKGFIDPEKPATEIAQEEDRLYYENATVELKNLTTGESFTLSKKESSELGIEREDGFFLKDPNYVYHYNGNPEDFNFNDKVQLVVKKDETADPVTAEITLLNDLLVVTPQSDKPVNFPTGAKYKVQWVEAAENPAVEYQVSLIFNISEADLLDEEPEFVEKTLVWNLPSVKNTTLVEVPGIDFFKFFQNRLEESSSLVRQFNYFDVKITYSGQEMEKFRKFLNANTGITSSQPIPPYTNLSSGLGLVAEKETIYIENVFLGTTSKDSLKLGQYTKNLNFQ